MLHVNNVCHLGGTMLFTHDVTRAYPEFHHYVVYVQDGGENYDVVERMATEGVDVSFAPKITQELVDQINPLVVFFNNTTDKHVEGEWPWDWLTPSMA